MEQARVNVVEPLEVGEPRTSSMANEFAAMRAAAERIEIAPGIRLARHLYRASLQKPVMAWRS